MLPSEISTGPNNTMKSTVIGKKQSNITSCSISSSSDSGLEVSSSQEQGITKPLSYSERWTNFIIRTFHRPLLAGIGWLAGISARNPWRTIALFSGVSIALLGIGFTTNMVVTTDQVALWLPIGSNAEAHLNEINKNLHFPTDNTRQFAIMLHKKGENALTKDAIRLIFNATDTLMQIPSYNYMCSLAGNANLTLPNGTQITTCVISGAMRFWGYSSLTFDWVVKDDNDVIDTMSKPNYPDGGRVIEDNVFGKPVRDPNGTLTSVLSYPWIITLPNAKRLRQLNSIYDVKKEELDYVDVILALSKAWQDDPATAGHYLEVSAQDSFGVEFQRGIVSDLGLVPFAFGIMVLFSCVYFYRRDKVESRTLLGLAAVVSVVLSLMTGFGINFICGVPFTTMTTIVPFIMFGVGLDDAFIIVDTYERSDRKKDTVERMRESMQECGVSIFITTLTSTLSFSSGLMSTIPAVRWMCFYAAPTIAIVLFFQITFFVACVVVDDNRIHNRRRDCCLCVKVNEAPNSPSAADHDITQDLSYRLMNSYANFILRPHIKVLVIANFIAFAGLCSWSASQLQQQFDFNDALPADSYLIEGIVALQEYRGNAAVIPSIIFRNVDFSDPEIQDQMDNYINDLVSLDAASSPPVTYWLRDFRIFLQNTTNVDLQSMTFEEQINLFLNDTVYKDLHKNNFGFKDGKVVETRCKMEYDKVDSAVVKSQIKALEDTDRVTAAQPVNAGLAPQDQKFFAYAQQFNAYSFYASCVRQLIGNTIFGIVSVTLVTVFLIPHWTAALFAGPIVCIMYVDILGVLQWAGISINAVSFVALVMSVGLIVDYLMHILLKYYETPGVSRRDKSTKTLAIMGASVLAGGFSTFLGTLPLAFSKTSIIWIVFVSFITLVCVALAHGLMFLPVLLATVGPQDEFLLKPSHEFKMEEPVLTDSEAGSSSSQRHI